MYVAANKKFKLLGRMHGLINFIEVQVSARILVTHEASDQ